MNARRYPRTMKQAFGPYTDNRLHPMPEPKRSHEAADIALYIVALIALQVVAARAAIEQVVAVAAAAAVVAEVAMP